LSQLGNSSECFRHFRISTHILVGGAITVLKNITVVNGVGIIPYTMENNPAMFETKSPIATDFKDL